MTVCSYWAQIDKYREIPYNDSAESAVTVITIHDTVHALWGVAPQMARDEARHGKAFAGLLKPHFGK